jgi:hypothetical protein
VTERSLTAGAPPHITPVTKLADFLSLRGMDCTACGRRRLKCLWYTDPCGNYVVVGVCRRCGHAEEF